MRTARISPPESCFGSAQPYLLSRLSKKVDVCDTVCIVLRQRLVGTPKEVTYFEYRAE